MKQKVKFKDSKNCLEANQLTRERNYQAKIKLDVGSLSENHK